jgi:hydrocephalus-inducing protein
MPEIQEHISVESPVRQTARSILTIENPLPIDVPVVMGSIAKPTEWWTCDSPYIKVNELSGLSGNNEGTFEVEFRPLKPTSQPTDHLITIITKELGTFKYKVTVKATSPLLKQVLRFDASLGSMQSESFIFRAYNSSKSDYACSVTKSEYFQVQNKLEVQPVQNGWNGDDVRLNVVFEPSIIGEIRDTLTVKSAEGGEYLCELIGNCTAPMPQGPYNLVQGVGAIDVPFRNCFSASATWSFSIDSNAFRIVAPTGIATVNGKTQSQCSVIFEPKEQHIAMHPSGGFITGKLFITCTSIANIPPWIFYLRGQIDLSVPIGAPVAAGKKK